MKRFLLGTDLDRTLLPNGAQPESAGARGRFHQLADCAEVTLAYVSGRHLGLIRQAIEEYDLPRPDFAIADVGTTIFRSDHGDWHLWEAWDEAIAPDWCNLSRDDLHRLLQVYPALRLQEDDKQNLHKLSYYVPVDIDTRELGGDMTARLMSEGVRANLVWSIDEQAGMGLLDVLPAGANKLHALRFIMQELGFEHGDAVFAGDSGNDLDVMLSEVPSVLVANADDDVKQRAAAAHQHTLYIARGGYLGMNGNYSAGILEGVAHFRSDVDDWLRAQEQHQ